MCLLNRCERVDCATCPYGIINTIEEILGLWPKINDGFEKPV